MQPGISKIIDNFFRFFAITQDLSIEEKGRRKLFANFIFLIVFPLIIFGIYLINKGVYRYGVIDVLIAFIFLLFIFKLRSVKDARLMYRTIHVLLFLLMSYWVNTGAINGYASLWLLAFPPFSLYLMGKREGITWTFLILVMTAAHFFMPALSITGFNYAMNYVSRYLFSFILITLFTYYYEAAREKYKKAMEDEQQKLKEQQSLLEETVNDRTLNLQKKMYELEESEKRYRLFADNITDMIWSLDRDLKFTYISPSVTRMYGYTVEEAMNLPHEKWNTPESYKKLMDELRNQLTADKHDADIYRTVILQLDHIKKDGTILPIELKASFIRDHDNSIIGFTGISRDISERIKIETEKEKIREQLVQAQKMEAIGTLAGGLAHDFNNFLGGIIGSFELISRLVDKEKFQSSDMINKYLGIGLESSKKSADLIKQLLALSRKHEIHLAPVDIQNSLEHVYELCKNSLPKSVEIEFSTCASPLVIMGEPAQIEQVLLNLCINASHAMTIMRSNLEKQGGILTIRAERIRTDNVIDTYYTEYIDTGTWARISIIDTGVGMDAETKNRIFEPFFSKKDKSSTGLGLAISYNIVQKHGGRFHVYSEPGNGSCFTIYLPVFDEELITHPGNKPQVLEKGSGTILVIDDEIFILNIAKGFLEQCGYDVITAEGAFDGIESYKKFHAVITAVLIDYSMPGKNGIEVFRELKEVNSGVRALLSSGMLDNSTREAAEESGIMDTVNKPYSITELASKMKELISA